MTKAELLENIIASAKRIGDYPNAEVVTCGNCGLSFPDVFPAARCPYEYVHPEIAMLRKR